MTKHNDQERALFEAFAKQIRDTVGEDDDAGCQDMSLDRQGGCYVCPETYAAWLAWQARAQLPAGGTIPEPVEIAAFLMEPDMYEPYVSLSRDSRCNGSVEPLMTVTQHNRIVAQLSAAPHPVSGEQSAAASDVLAERNRQVNKEGWTAEHDDRNGSCELAAAAATYAVCTEPEQLMVGGAVAWPWRRGWWKPTTYRQNLIKAGALIIAEIERLDRAAHRAEQGEQP